MTDLSLSLSAVRRVLAEASLLLEGRGVSGDGEGALEGPDPLEDRILTGVSQDSRTIQAGELFMAWAGAEWDAHDYVADAVARGAAAVLVERPLQGLPVPQIVVVDGRRAAALVADAAAGSPWRRLELLAVTGTNGKTTTALMVRHLLSLRGAAAALGTLGVVGPDGEPRSGTGALTTPGPVQLSSWLAGLADEGIRSVVMEASSHALEQRRLDGVRFRAAAFTNLTQDHLDYHGSMEEYRRAKLHLVELVAAGGVVVVNLDDPAWAGLPDEYPEANVRWVSFALNAPARLTASHVTPGSTGTRFRLHADGESVEVDLPLPGLFNVENALAATGLTLALGLTLEEVGAGLSGAPQVPGRLEVVVSRPVRVLIDFAHTPEALDRVLETLRPLVPGRLIVVFGAGGDRDRGKRPRMGAVAEARADLVVVTSDNPRTEDPARIVDDILAGMSGDRFERIVDRRAAIARALELAGPADLVLLAGKGHERTQTIGTETFPFDERVVVRELLEGRAA
jgi:UDP-N-acetylmuramoyl-L-alanyl-D-glutamate--2,6-diaminopimelate ligase